MTPALTATPTAGIVHKGSAVDVTVTLEIVARCGHGHQHIIDIPDYDDLDQATTRIADWASQHADTCPGNTARLHAA